MTDEQLADELRALGRSVVPPVAEGLTSAVLERVADQPVRRTPMDVIRRKWRALLALLAVLVAGLALTPPVRAAVAEWLSIGGVEARPVPSGPSTAPALPVVTGRLSLEDAGRRAGFVPVVPKVLGTPTGVEASTGMIAMSWSAGQRLEQFAAELSPLYVKKYHSSLEPADGVEGYWFPTPHDLVLLDKDGNERVERVAGATLVWVYDGLTFRLEGVADKARATEIAVSATR